MQKIISIFALLLVIFISLSQTTKIEAQSPATSKEEDVKNTQSGEVVSRKIDRRAEILQKYLEGFNSPLQYNAQDFIDASDQFGLDWKMIPSIAGVESTFGKHIPGGYNAWGWGVYGTQAIYFNSWKDGIFTLAKGLRENYINKGLTEPYAINRIYASSPTWGSRVSYFMNELEKFAKKFEAENTISIATPISDLPKVAANSGELALKTRNEQ